MIDYLPKESVILTNDYVTSGKGTVIKPNELDMAIESIKQNVFGKELYPDLFSKAAHLCYALSQYPPFSDGNKRTAAIATLIFLDWNGITLDFLSIPLGDLILDLVNHKITEEDFSNILKKEAKRR